VAVVVAALILLLVIYVGGYFTLGDNYIGPFGSNRWYRSASIACAYQPLGWIEALATRHDVELIFPYPSGHSTWYSYHFKP
jgi:hypothetical protein